MSESNGEMNRIKTKSIADVVTELSELIDEIRFRAKRTGNPKGYARYIGMLMPLYGILLKALSGGTITREDTEEIQKAVAHLIEVRPRRVTKIILRNGVVRYAGYY